MSILSHTVDSSAAFYSPVTAHGTILKCIIAVGVDQQAFNVHALHHLHVYSMFGCTIHILV